MNRSAIHGPIMAAMIATSMICAAPAHGQAFEKGDDVLGIGFGLGGHYNAYSSYTAQTPAIGLSYEKATSLEVGPGVLGMGGYLGYKSLVRRKNNRVYEEDWRWTYYILGFRAAYHYNDWHGVSKLDTYGGLMLSYNAVSFTDRTDYPSGYSYTGSSSGGLGLSLYLGTRYFFNERLGAFLELGYGISYGTIGLAIKL